MERSIENIAWDSLKSLSLDQLERGSRIRIQTTQGSTIELFVVSAGGFSESGKWKNECLILNWNPKIKDYRKGAFVELIGEFKVNGQGFIHLTRASPDQSTEGLKASEGIEPSKPHIASMEGANLISPNILKRELLDAITVLQARSSIDYKAAQGKIQGDVMAVFSDVSQTDTMCIGEFSKEEFEPKQEVNIQGLLQMADLLIHHLTSANLTPWEGPSQDFEKAMQTIQKAISCYRDSNTILDSHLNPNTW